MKEQYCIDNLVLCHLNIRCLKQNLADFERYLNLLYMRLTISGVSETWLDDCDCLLYELNGYHLTEEHRVSKRGGGVGIFVKNGICFSKREDLCIFEEYVECVTIEINKSSLNSDKNIIVCVIYRPSNTDTLVLNEMFSDLLDIIRRENKLCYILGDYNINPLNHDTLVLQPSSWICTSLVTQYCSITIDHCNYYVFCRRSLKRSCTPDYWIFSIITRFSIAISLDFANAFLIYGIYSYD